MLRPYGQPIGSQQDRSNTTMGIEPAEPASSCDICLVVPPFDAINFPALGTAILATACRARGMSVTIVYGSILLAAEIGYDDYCRICDSPIRTMMGERLFRRYAFPPEIERTIPDGEPLTGNGQAVFDRAAPLIDPFLDDLADRVLALRPKLIGIASTFQQNLAAGATALRLKARAPDLPIVLGGANVSTPMGEGLAQVFPWIDRFVSGEADLVFPALCETYLKTGALPDEKLVACGPIDDMRVVHTPNFADYFAVLRECQAAGKLPMSLPEFLTLESSRGCWWGQKNHCVFCGLNALGMDFRKKDARRVFRELKDLTETWGVKRVAASDNIMPLNYLDELMPALAAWEGRPHLFYEVKANLREDQMDVLAAGGVNAIQPGIESLSSRLLKLMRKGVSGHQNIALLRHCKARNISVGWNYIYGFVGEEIADYDGVIEMMPKIEHLEPPTGCNQIIVDRYSPYHTAHKELGIGEITPYPSYYALYPPDAPLMDIAYHFKGSYTTPLLSSPADVERLCAAIERWRERWRTPPHAPALRLLPRPNGAVIVDTRSIARAKLTIISREQDEALKVLDRPKPLDALDPETRAQVPFLLERDFVIDHEGLLLTVVTRPRVLARPIAARPADQAEMQAA
ncbi:RiPP maturation radical SAM C-methyltransferase [Sphingomonas sp. QA11]|uniref:RiPP maturation radical SAM C-methyltransferase n=1 Tax=Sphingomonas sp. QA11 TaxID=2950605 RepID=UPI00234A457F|nr:RiPP maturation radical SAM C-methyltransferase [Sphingomonas sp. QA11]WCM25777.1 RiPP maturation radical SAM C-methyltransferase [Sphingomonas sp. QA11]